MPKIQLFLALSQALLRSEHTDCLGHLFTRDPPSSRRKQPKREVGHEDDLFVKFGSEAFFKRLCSSDLQYQADIHTHTKNSVSNNHSSPKKTPKNAQSSPVSCSQCLQIPAVLQMDRASSSSPPSPATELSHHPTKQQLISGCVNF